MVRTVGPQQRLKKTRVPGKDRQVSLIKNLLVRTRRYLISPIPTPESRGLWQFKKRLGFGKRESVTVKWPKCSHMWTWTIFDVIRRFHTSFICHFDSKPVDWSYQWSYTLIFHYTVINPQLQLGRWSEASLRGFLPKNLKLQNWCNGSIRPFQGHGESSSLLFCSTRSSVTYLMPVVLWYCQ